jgi:hypothetical protein
MLNDEQMGLDELNAAIAAEEAEIKLQMQELIEEQYPVKVAEFVGDFAAGDDESITGRVQITSDSPDWPSGEYAFVSGDRMVLTAL